MYEKVQFEVFGLDLEGIFGKEFPDVYDPRHDVGRDRLRDLAVFEQIMRQERLRPGLHYRN